MANVNSVSNSYSSIYGNKNIISGLATGMDTETMISNAIKPYETKVIELQQQQERISWKQDAVRDLIGQMNDITQKYTSYTSKTNLSSNAFFTKAIKTTASGTNASAVSATGKASSEIRIDKVEQLATSARYAVAADKLSFNDTVEMTGGKFTLTGTKEVSTIAGTLSLTLGKSRIDLDFAEGDVYSDAQELTDAINDKLTVQNASVRATLQDGKIQFKSTATNGDDVYISGASGRIASTLDVKYASSSAAVDRFAFDSITVGGTALSEQKSMQDYLADKTVEVTLNGVSKEIRIGDLNTLSDEDQAEIDRLTAERDAYAEDDAIGRAQMQLQIDDYTAKATAHKLVSNLNAGLKEAFGEGEVTVKETDGKLEFGVKPDSGSSVSIKSKATELGLMNGLSNYFNTGRTLSSLLGDDYFKAAPKGTVTADAEGVNRDANGARVSDDGQYLVDDEGNALYEEKELEINGVSLGKFGKDSTLESVMSAINSSAEGGAKVSFSRLTNEFVFTSASTGENQKIDFGESGSLAYRLFDNGQKNESNYTKGKDAKLTATVNGGTVNLKRSTNNIDMDGMSVTLKSTFDSNGVEADAVSFKSASDADSVVSTIKTFVEDINKLMTDLHSAYTTQPLKKSKSSTAMAQNKSGSNYYMPLTEEDKEGMSESAIKAYEEKAKQGLLFQDTDISTAYEKLRAALTDSGSAADMAAIGLTTSYANGVTTLSLDEDKLRSALEGDPDKVRSVFTKTVEGGAKSNGLMERLKIQLKAYGSTSLGSQGILVRKAGTKLSAVSMLNNTYQTQITNYDKQIEKWRSKMSDKIDYYTKQFTALEQMMSSMNGQSSMLSQLMG